MNANEKSFWLRAKKRQEKLSESQAKGSSKRSKMTDEIKRMNQLAKICHGSLGDAVAQPTDLPKPKGTDNLLCHYPIGIEVKGDNVFKDGRYMGYVDRVPNWGTDFLARCEHGKPNRFFITKTEAVIYLAT